MVFWGAEKMKRKQIVFAGFVLLGLIIAIALPHARLPSQWISVGLWVDLSSLLTLISFSLQNVLMLRILAVLAELTFIPYALFQEKPLWSPIVWNCVFMAINLYHIVLLILEKRPVKFTPDEQTLYDLKFKSLEPREFVKLLTVAQWKACKAGEKIMEHGKDATEIYVLSHGQAKASGDGHDWFTIEPGELIGTTSALLGEPYFFDAECTRDSKYVYFPLGPLNKLTNKNPSLRQKMIELENRDFAIHLSHIEKMMMESGQKPTQQMVENVAEKIQEAAEKAQEERDGDRDDLLSNS